MTTAATTTAAKDAATETDPLVSARDGDDDTAGQQQQQQQHGWNLAGAVRASVVEIADEVKHALLEELREKNDDYEHDTQQQQQQQQPYHGGDASSLLSHSFGTDGGLSGAAPVSSSFQSSARQPADDETRASSSFVVPPPPQYLTTTPSGTVVDAKYLLEMNLVRNLSILPADVERVAATGALIKHHDSITEEIIDGPPEQQQQHQGRPSSSLISSSSSSVIALRTESIASVIMETPWTAYLLLATAVVALSSIAPFMDVQQDASAVMKMNWRMCGTSILLLPVAIYDVTTDPTSTAGGLYSLSFGDWFVLFFAAVGYMMLSMGFVIALDYTSVGNTVILSNSQAIMLLIGRLLTGNRISWLEGCGAIVAFTGAVLCSKDSSDMAPTSLYNNTLLGDAYSIMAGIGGTIYLVLAKVSRKKVTSLPIFMFLVMLIGTVLSHLIQVTVFDEKVTYGFDVSTGVWGWLVVTRFDRFWLEVIIVVVCNVAGLGGYVAAMSYFNNLTIATAALLEPVVAEFTAWALGVAFLPGILGWTGNLLVAGGTLAVIYPTTPANKDDSGKNKK